METNLTVNSSTTFAVLSNTVVKFIGHDKTLRFILGGGNDKVIAKGVDQTIFTARTGPITIVDHARGLTLDFGAGAADIVVKDFENDATGKVRFANPVTLTPDHHGGILATSFGTTVDFKGFHCIAALEARILPPFGG
jgi:hypothetical protein